MQIYLLGLVIAFILILSVVVYNFFYKKDSITVFDILLIGTVTIFSWFGVLFVLYYFYDTIDVDTVLIKAKK